MDIEQRLNRLERQNRRMKKGMIGMVVAGFSLLVMAQASPPKIHDLIRAKKIEVVSDNGRRVILLESWKLGGRISTNNKKGKTLFTVSATDNGNGLIATYSSKGKKLVSITSTRGNNGAIATHNSKGKVIVDLSAAGDAGGSISTYDHNGTALIGIKIRKNGSGAVVHYNRAGKPDRVWP